MVKVGDREKCPECNRIGRVVWVSKDGKREGIQCPASHHQAIRPNSRFGSLARPRSKSSKNMVFITDVK
jgi:hypothetical protein